MSLAAVLLKGWIGLLNSYLYEIVLRNITELNNGVKILIGFNFVFGIRLCLDVDEDSKASNGSLHFAVVCFVLFLFFRVCLLLSYFFFQLFMLQVKIEFRWKFLNLGWFLIFLVS